MLEKSGVLANGAMIEVADKDIKMMQHSGRSLIVEQVDHQFFTGCAGDDVTSH